MGRGGNQKVQSRNWKVSAISRNYPSYRSFLIISTESWLKGKRKDDAAEGLWRIGDNLYDFSKFIDQHPGGTFWLKETKGTDITEPFESHHISTLPEKLLDKYKVRVAAQPRNYKFTFNDNGFYKTLKSRVRDHLSKVDKTPCQRTNIFHALLLLSTFVLSAASARTGSAIYEILAALSLCWLAIASHNYFHRKDNWQMYTFNLTLLNFCNWRISHALSHHVYPNSLYDLELSLFEPFLCWIPSKYYASKLRRIISLIIQPIVYISVFIASFLIRVLISIRQTNILYWHDAIGFLLPLVMYLTSTEQAPLIIIRQWFCILALSSFIFSIIGLNAAHHDPEILHEGDANREDLDWGLFQVDTIIDRGDIKNSQFLVLTHFGEHILHHLFPTLDHGILPQLNSILLKTLDEFGVDMREQSYIAHIIGQNRQLLRTTPNLKPPGRKVY